MRYITQPLGVFLVWLTASVAVAWLQPPIRPLLLGLWVWMVVYYVTVALHELVHWLAAVRQGWSLAVLSIGPVRLDATGDHLKLRPNPEWRLAFSGAIGLRARQAPMAQLLTEYQRLIIAAPLANVGLGVVLLTYNLAYPTQPTSPINMLCVCNLAVGLVSLLPISGKSARLPSDGTQFLWLRQKRPYAQRIITHGLLQSEALSPVRPRDWSSGIVQAVENDWLARPPAPDVPRELMRHAYALTLIYYHYADRGEYEHARRLLEPYVVDLAPGEPDLPPAPGESDSRQDSEPEVVDRADVIPVEPQSVVREDHKRSRYDDVTERLYLLDTVFALHLALYDREIAQARAILENVDKQARVKEFTDWHMAWAAIYLAENQAEKALEALNEAEKRLRSHSTTNGISQRELEMMNQMRQRAQASLAPNAVALAGQIA